MPVPITVKVIFLWVTFFPSTCLKNQLLSQISSQKPAVCDWPSAPEGTRSRGLGGAKKPSKNPLVFRLVSTTAYSHLHVNGLYGREWWTGAIGVIGCLNSYSWDHYKVKDKKNRVTLVFVFFRLGANQLLWRQTEEICSLTSSIKRSLLLCFSVKGHNRSRETEPWGILGV